MLGINVPVRPAAINSRRQATHWVIICEAFLRHYHSVNINHNSHEHAFHVFVCFHACAAKVCCFNSCSASSVALALMMKHAQISFKPNWHYQQPSALFICRQSLDIVEIRLALFMLLISRFTAVRRVLFIEVLEGAFRDQLRFMLFNDSLQFIARLFLNWNFSHSKVLSDLHSELDVARPPREYWWSFPTLNNLTRASVLWSS